VYTISIPYNSGNIANAISECLVLAESCGTFLSAGRILSPYQIKPANGESWPTAAGLTCQS